MLTNKYSQNNVKADQVHFWDCANQPSFEAIASANSELINGAERSGQVLTSFQVEKDGIGLKGINLQIIAHYSPGWRKINSMCLCDHNIFISHCQGISKVNLETGECQLMVGLVDPPCVLTRFGMDILFKNQMKSCLATETEWQVRSVCWFRQRRRKYRWTHQELSVKTTNGHVLNSTVLCMFVMHKRNP